MKRYEPNNLNLIKLLPASEKKHIDRYGYIVSHLYEKRFSDDRWKDLKKGQKVARRKYFVPMNMVLLQKIIGTRHAKRVLDNLLEWRVIEGDNQYTVGARSKSYRLTAKYTNSPFITHDYGVKFHRRLRKVLTVEREKNLQSIHTDIAAQVERYFGLDTLKAPRLLKSLSLDPLSSIRAKLAVSRLLSGDLGHIVSKKSGRYFNTIVNLKRELRAAIICRDGSRLVEVDIANSQPFFLAFFLACIQRNNAGILNIAENLGIDAAPLLGKFKTKEFERFTDLTTRGVFYDYFCERLGLERDEVKEKMMQTFFKPMHYTTPFEQQFAKLFPRVFEVMRYLKPMGAHNTLALLLQRMESMVVIESFCDILLIHEVPFIPIHDSVIVPEQHAANVAEALGDTSHYFSGLRPTVRIKDVEQKKVKSRKTK